MPDNSDFGSFGRFQETPVDQMSLEMKEAYNFTKQLRGLVPGPHRIWLANPKLSKTIVPTGAYYQTQSTLTKGEIEIVTNLINASWLAAYSNYEHEKIGEQQGHLPAHKVECIIAGLPVSFDDPRQQAIYELTLALVTPRIVPLGLYRRAKELIGDAGIVDVSVLIGWFTMVSATLNAFDVPSNANGVGPMTQTASQRLGGRIPLLDPTKLNQAQKELYDHINAQLVPWADAPGFESKTSDGKLIGPFNPVLFSPAIGASFLELQKSEEAHTSLSERQRQVVILSVGSVWNAPYEVYAHQAVARKAALSEKTIQSLTAGETSEEFSREEQLAQQFTLQLAAKDSVDDAVFASAHAAFGEKGLVDIIALAGCYMLICSLLNAFQIPVPSDSQERP